LNIKQKKTIAKKKKQKEKEKAKTHSLKVSKSKTRIKKKFLSDRLIAYFTTQHSTLLFSHFLSFLLFSALFWSFVPFYLFFFTNDKTPTYSPLLPLFALITLVLPQSLGLKNPSFYCGVPTLSI